MDQLDRTRLREALQAAESAIGLSDPNPRVGCVIGSADGAVFGIGATQAAGGPHAEVMALREARAQGRALAGATAWVTLEPCSHHGRTPPCCDALVESGIARVVIGIRDPNPRVNGRGAARLAAAGIEVAWAPDDIAAACRDINIGFFSRHERGRPWVRMKAAISADGRVARADGSSQWITGAAARQDGHRWRLRAGALLTGVGTVLADDPLLNVRLPQARRQPLRVVVDSAWRTPATARLFAAAGPVLVIGTQPVDGPSAIRLRHAGAELLRLPADAAGRVDLGPLMAALAEREVNELHLEAGPALNGAMLDGDWVDEWLLYLAPRLVGAGLPPASLNSGEALAEPPRWQWHAVEPIDGDLRLLARRRDAHLGGVGPAYSSVQTLSEAPVESTEATRKSVEESIACSGPRGLGTDSA